MAFQFQLNLFLGNTLDHLTLKPALKNNIDNLEFSRFILISDRSIFQYRNLLHVLQAGNGYIVSKSLLKSTQRERDWNYDDNAYVKVSNDFKYKSRVIKNIKDVYFSLVKYILYKNIDFS